MLALLVAVGSMSGGCAGLMRGYVSSPKAEGGVEKSETELCLKLQTVDLCVMSATVADQFHLFFLGLYVGVPLPFIPMPYGTYEFFSPPEKKNVAEEIVIRLFDKDEKFSFDPIKVVLEKLDKRESNPTKFECTVDELGYQHKITSTVEIPLTKGIYCRLTFDSYDWDFDLLINGIETKGRPLDVPPIHFRRGIARSWMLKT
jgi:hypothetical protein